MTDWLMVIITAVYVVATIFIWKANKMAAEASKEQLEESKRQFEESQKQAKAELEESKRQFDITKQQAEEQFNEQKNQYEESIRIQCMPFLQMEHQSGSLHDENFSMNFFLCKSEEMETIVHYFKLKNIGNGHAINLVYALKYNDDFECDPMPICGIRAGDEYLIKIEFDIDADTELFKPNIEFLYFDVLKNEYSQNVTIVMDLNEGTIVCENDEPTFLGTRFYTLAKKESKNV
ncbi:hypothetical protein [Ruminococcus sp.]|uniref:cell envelope integrity protein TolA n=1 Tax=Ruminococcus sp. TaxID=41978 RepID=UPI0025D30C2E|nr:hypothetical protein [Ruminococcus sp.]